MNRILFPIVLAAAAAGGCGGMTRFDASASVGPGGDGSVEPGSSSSTSNSGGQADGAATNDASDAEGGNGIDAEGGTGLDEVAPTCSGACPLAEPTVGQPCMGPWLCEYRHRGECPHVYSCEGGEAAVQDDALVPAGGSACGDGGDPSWVCSYVSTSEPPCVCSLAAIPSLASDAGVCSVCSLTIPAIGTPCTEAEKGCSYSSGCGGPRVFCGPCGFWLYAFGTRVPC